MLEPIGDSHYYSPFGFHPKRGCECEWWSTRFIAFNITRLHMGKWYISVLYSVLTLSGYCCGGTTKRGRKANSIWIPTQNSSAFYKGKKTFLTYRPTVSTVYYIHIFSLIGWLWPWISWICGKFVPRRFDSDRVLFSRYGRKRRTYRYCSQDSWNRFDELEWELTNTQLRQRRTGKVHHLKCPVVC